MKNLWKWVLATAAFVVGVVALVTSQSKGKKVYDKKVNDNNDEVKKVKIKTKESCHESSTI